MTGLAELLAPTRWARLRAARGIEPSPALAFALRRVLYTDLDAEVRAAAARRLGELPGPVESWLLDALGDGSPLVRDAILRSLAKLGTTAAVPALRALAERDPMWWIRRGAIYALAAIAGAAELPALTSALADPFWRVRHAAVKVLAVLGARDPDVRDEVLAAPPSTTLTYLRGSWGPVAIEAPARAAAPSALPPELLDPDPAVVTARLLDRPTADPVALVELLCDPHVPLRALAARRIAASGRLDAYEAALDWLEQPRIPHVVDTVHHLLDGLGDPATTLAQRVLSRPRGSRPGAVRWAIEWVVATRSESLYDAARACARDGDPAARIAARRLIDDAELARWAEPSAGEPSPLVDEIAIELHDRRAEAADDALLALDGVAHPRTRALQVDARARRGDWLPVEAALGDPHHGPRAVAARWLVRRPEGAVIAGDVDPAVREAAITPATAAAGVGDEDPWVRRAALRMLVAVHRDRAALPAEAAAAARVALVATDPQLRAQACGLPIVDDTALALVLERLADRDAGVRAAAHDALDRLSRSDARVRAVLDAGALSTTARAIAYGWLVRALDDAAVAVARAALAADPAAEPAVRGVLAAVAGVDLEGAPEHALASSARRDLTPPAPRPNIAHRRFGRAGFDVAPLAISGAHDLQPRALDAAEGAGVDLYFWEPGYDALGRFLRTRRRRDRARVITGTYHADAASIRADVDRALRQLRRDSLDAFLLFWTRSPARVDADAFAILDALKRAGKIRAIGFSTHHRSLAREAIETSPWDVVMIRHSAAHPGIESELLPTARALGTAIVTFSALTYGRMISGPDAPSPADCYRYSLAQPGVTACISAPRRHDELVENLGVLGAPPLAPEQLAALRRHGARVHAESQRFNTLVRQPTRDAAAAARELLATELPPDAEAPRAAPRFPQPSGARRSRTRLGAPRRGSR